MSVYTIINEKVAEFIKNNEDSGVVVQIKKASQEKNRKVFACLLAEIKQVIRMEQEIDRLHMSIESHRNSIKDISREIRIKKNCVKNGKNFHKIKGIK